MKIYLVGGAVRDALLGFPHHERDYVVVGASPEEMIAAGYRPVGRDFPVFLHPQTSEEYALARTERKTAGGYHGFVFHTGAQVTLEEDLARRDLTVNAIARADDGSLIDPYGGQRDLQARVLRHVSPAFAEDPVRVLRLARFHARYAPLGFTVAPETMALMRRMVDDGEIDHLVAERVWTETRRALLGDGRAAQGYRPSRYFELLHHVGALARLMPELAAQDGVPQRADYHPEVDTLVHTLMCVDAAHRMDFAIEVRVTALLHDLGKAVTPREEWPSHRGHDARGVPLVAAFAERLRLSNAERDLALAVTRDHLLVHIVRDLRPGTLLGLIERLGGLRRSEFFERALESCLCDARGRLGFEDCAYPQVDVLREAARVAREAVEPRTLLAQGLQGAALGEALKKHRIAALTDWRRRRQLSESSTAG